MILKQHLMLINEKENIIRVYRTSLAFCAVPSLSVGLRVCGFAGLRVQRPRQPHGDVETQSQQLIVVSPAG